MPDKPTETTDQTDDATPLVNPAEQMPSMVEETITEGLDPSELEDRTIHLK